MGAFFSHNLSSARVNGIDEGLFENRLCVSYLHKPRKNTKTMQFILLMNIAYYEQIRNGIALIVRFQGACSQRSFWQRWEASRCLIYVVQRSPVCQR